MPCSPEHTGRIVTRRYHLEPSSARAAFGRVCGAFDEDVRVGARMMRRARIISAAVACAVLVVLLGVAGASAHVRSAVPRAQSAIVGGTPAPGVRGLAFIVNRDLSAACSGSVVASNVVLTAAHCVVDLDERTVSRPEAVEVRTGTVDKNDTAHAQISGVTRIFVHPLFNTRRLRDASWSNRRDLVTASPRIAS